jgi:hypothetical protein
LDKAQSREPDLVCRWDIGNGSANRGAMFENTINHQPRPSIDVTKKKTSNQTHTLVPIQLSNITKHQLDQKRYADGEA